MSFKQVRSGAEKQKTNNRNHTNDTKPLHEKYSRFTYELTKRQLEIIIGTGAKTEIRKIAETGKEKERRVEAVKGLAEIDDKDSIPVLEEIAKTDPEEEVRNEAGKAIRKLRGEKQNFVEKKGIEELDISEIIDDAMGFAGDETLDDDFPDFEIEDPEAEKRLQEYSKRALLEKFREGNDGSIYMVIELALVDENEVLQRKAIEALIDSEDWDALNMAKMIVGNDEEYEEFRKKIEFKLSALIVRKFQEGDESKIPEVAKMLFENERHEIKQMAFEALISSKNPDGMDAVRLYLIEEEKNLGEKEMSFKRFMLKEMDGIRHPKFLDIFIEVLRFTSDQKVMDTMISSMFMYGSRRALEVLEYTANREDIDDETRKDALTALSLLGGW